MPADAGLTAIELMVALAVFAVAASGIAGGLMVATKTTGNDRGRIAAANLAQREIEIVRNTFTGSEAGPQTVIAAGSAVNPNPLPGGVAGQPLLVDGRPYTVTRALSWLTSSTGASPCDGGTATAHPKLALTVTVTWPSMGDIKPVQARTILTPPLGVLNSSTSFVAVKVIDAAGRPNPGRKVNLTDSSGLGATVYTEADGCGVFATTKTGAHTVSLNTEGFVDPNGVQDTRKAITVNASSFQRLEFSYDQAVVIKTRLVTDAGYTVPAGVGSVTLGSTVFTNGRKSFPASTATSTIDGLWPVSSGYELWAGSCEQSDPAAAGGTRGAPAAMAPGDVSSVIDARLTPVDVRVGDDDAPAAGVEIVARPTSSTSCSASETVLGLGFTDASGALKTALPAGVWRLMPKNATNPGASYWPTTPSLLPTSPAQTMYVPAS